MPGQAVELPEGDYTFSISKQEEEPTKSEYKPSGTEGPELLDKVVNLLTLFYEQAYKGEEATDDQMTNTANLLYEVKLYKEYKAKTGSENDKPVPATPAANAKPPATSTGSTPTGTQPHKS
jgi:hypothetical protein